MTKPRHAELYGRCFDHVLLEIEAGRTGQGISLLVGMLDAWHLRGRQPEHARAVLAGHVLHQLLLEEPMYRHAAAHPDDADGLMRLAGTAAAAAAVTPTGLRLAEATAGVAVVRALRQRRVFADEYIARAWRDGLRICLLGDTAIDAHSPLYGRDLSNVTLASGTRSLHRPDAFDFICAATVADACSGRALDGVFKTLRRTLSSGGTAIVAALLPAHSGNGWTQTCLGWRPRLHTADALRVRAAAAGLTAQICNDATNCIAWCVLRRAPDAGHRGAVA